MTDAEALGLLALGGAGATVGLVEMVKRLIKRFLGFDDATISDIAPVLAIAAGIFWNWLLLAWLRAADSRFETVLLFGIVSGLAGSGLWSSGRQALGEPTRALPPRG